jgi:hypothetical protein
MVHPVDAECCNALKNIANELAIKKDYYVFYKQYTPAHILLYFQECILNMVRVKILKSYVWTNCPIFKKTVFIRILSFNKGFLEDVISSDYLKGTFKLGILKTPVIISARRYMKDIPLKRIFGNIYIMVLYRLRLKSVEQLKVMYSGVNNHSTSSYKS